MTHQPLEASADHPHRLHRAVPRRHAGRWHAAQRLCMLLVLALSGWQVAHATGMAASTGAKPGAAQSPRHSEASRLWMTVGERRFAITLANTRAARAFAAMLPLTLSMEELNGNEKKKDLQVALPTDAIQPGTIRNGDLMLWGSRTVVIFYLDFESPYAYTRLGRVDDPAGLAQALGRGGVQVMFSLD